MSRAAELRDGSPEEVGMLSERIALAREFAAEAVRKGRTPSLAVLVARRGVVVLHEAFGELRPGGPPLPRDAIYPISSATKPLTAALAMILAEDGLLSVARPAVEYLPELSGEGIEEVLVHHLLTHTSGFDDEVLGEWMLKKISSRGMPELPEHAHPFHHLMLATCMDAPRAERPGELMTYCNFNYTLLGEIVQRVSGKPLEVYARERLFEPLGMNGSDYVVRDDMRERLLERPADAPLSTELEFAPGAPGIETEAWQRMPNGGAGAYSTARDLAVFGQMVLNGGRYGDRRILSRPVVAEMTRNQIPGVRAKFFDLTVSEGSYGYGWMIRSHLCWGYFCGLTPPGSLSHTGAGGIAFWIDPEHEMVQVYLEVTMNISESLEPLSWGFDSFQNVILSAVDD